ncbi:hypothetical protein PHMEG_00018388 [Phytophthora megakarya]|uniref:Peptidase S1 domain-containing protein n=1 Tax=Phytophthora megakarya TaxID=4795 RepID=A0A225VUH8_9STRA|nr:hypothetical protein PHMEG_00018388 [Phytophthora megakarya]
MKFAQISLFASMIATFVHGFSFSEISSELTADEESRIFGGSIADIDSHKYVASLHNYGVTSDKFCAGMLISPEFLITAGHCLNTPMFNVWAIIGSNHRMGGGSRNSEMIKVVEAFRHPMYNSSNDFVTIPYDVALLKLETPSKIKPVRLAAADGSDSKAGSMATTLGWGLIKNETESQLLRTVDIKILTTAECVRLYAMASGVSPLAFGNVPILDNSTICAGSGNGKDSCEGDSGGPLLVNDVLVGIVSSGYEECGISPGSYASVSEALDFITEIIGGGSTGNVTDKLTASTNIFELLGIPDGSNQ